MGTSLGGQGLRVCTLTAGGEGSTPNQRTRSHVPLGLAWPGGKRERGLETERLTGENNRKIEKGGPVVKNPPSRAGDEGDVGLIPGSGRSIRGGCGNLLQYSCLEDPMDRGACQAPRSQRVGHE